MNQTVHPVRRRVGFALLLAALSLVAWLSLGSTAQAGNQLLTGYGDGLFSADSATTRNDAYAKAAKAGGDVVRLSVNWRAIAPEKKRKGFKPRDPGDPAYDWGTLDSSVREAEAHGQRVLLMVFVAPRWAEGRHRPASADPGTWKPNPGDLADFATAVARRYSGNYAGLPRVRDYLCWGEANLETNLTPVWRGPKDHPRPASPQHYKKMLNAFYGAVHDVSKSNRVVTAETAPYGADPGVLNMRPLLFWRTLLCVKNNKRLGPKKNCKPPKFDVLAHNPINTAGGPYVSAISPDDVSTPDLHNLVDVLRASERAHHTGRHPVWATEIWWESNPPDPASGNPSPQLQADWYVEALHLLWQQGASMVLLLQVQDSPYDGKPGRINGNFQTGVYTVKGKAKPAMAAMRFPFLANRKSKKTVSVWGVAPASGEVQIRAKGKHGALKKLHVGARHVFNTKVRLGGTDQQLRAQLGSTRSRYWKVK